MFPFDDENRDFPTHYPPQSRRDQPVIVFVTVCTVDRSISIANDDTLEILTNTWRRIDDWRIGSFVIMPDHIHLLCAPRSKGVAGLPRWMSVWKAISSRSSNRSAHRIRWQRDYWDTQIRNSTHLMAQITYMQRNPVARGLCKTPDEWPYRGKIFNIGGGGDFRW